MRILRTYPGPWRVYLRVVINDNDEDRSTPLGRSTTEEGGIDWIEIGSKEVLESKSSEWEKSVNEDGGMLKDGGKIFDYGIPTYREIEEMIVSRDGYRPKSLSERATTALTFIKDTL